MRKLYSPKLIVPYGLLVVIFAKIFDEIKDSYLKESCLADPARNYPIDVHFYKTWRFFDPDYVRTEGLGCYDVHGYFWSFFPLDMVFPIVYSLLMLSIVHLLVVKKARKILSYTILAGALADYFEDFSFARFLDTHADLFTGLTTLFTSLKTCLLLINGISCILILLMWTTKMILSRMKPVRKI